VLVPGLTDDPANIEAVGRIVAQLRNFEWLEVLPLHQMEVFKWSALHLDYPLQDTPTPEQVGTAMETLCSRLRGPLTHRRSDVPACYRCDWSAADPGSVPGGGS
jgi:hypothetical protein